MIREYILMVDDWESINEDGAVCLRSHLTGEEIIRCEDCKWFDTETYSKEHPKGFCPNIGCLSEPDWYCADGERKVTDA